MWSRLFEGKKLNGSFWWKLSVWCWKCPLSLRSCAGAYHHIYGGPPFPLHSTQNFYRISVKSPGPLITPGHASLPRTIRIVRAVLTPYVPRATAFRSSLFLSSFSIFINHVMFWMCSSIHFLIKILSLSLSSIYHVNLPVLTACLFSIVVPVICLFPLSCIS